MVDGFVMTSAKAEADCVENAARIVKGTDWSKMKTATVKIKDFTFNPHTLRFKKDASYKLEIKNVGTEKHYSTATARRGQD